MFGSIGRSWNLAKQSLGVVRKDPELMIFPIIAFIAGVVVAGILGGVGFATGAFGGSQSVSALGILFIFLFYFGTYFITIYFQVALVASVKLRLSGGNPTLGYGVREANKRLGAVLTWAVIAAIVGLLLRLLEGAARNNTRGWGRIVAQIAIGLVGMAWSLATFFVIPVIAYEGVGSFEAIKRSVGVIKRSWGEAVVGQAWHNAGDGASGPGCGRSVRYSRDTCSDQRGHRRPGHRDSPHLHCRAWCAIHCGPFIHSAVHLYHRIVRVRHCRPDGRLLLP